jgi:hypothetical protein
MLPAAVRVVVQGMPGLEVDTWGQEIPIMCTTVGDNTGEVDDEQVAEPADDTDSDTEPSDPGGD